MNYDNWKLQTPDSYFEKEEVETTIKCDLCYEYFPEEESEVLGSNNCVCPVCVLMSEENQ